MAVNLSAGAVSRLSRNECQSVALKPVLQVMDIRSVQTQPSAGGAGGENKDRYRIVLSDGSFHQQAMLANQLSELARSQQLQKGSIVILTEFVCNSVCNRTLIIIVDLNVIINTFDIIGDPKPFPLEFPGNQPSVTTVGDAHFTTKETPAGSFRGPNSFVVPTCHASELQHNAGDNSNNGRTLMEKNKEDDVGACIEKLDKLGWGTEDPLYDTALLLFCESDVHRKLWLHLKRESCGKWVRNAGSKYGLLV